MYVRDGKPVWNAYSFADQDIFEDGTRGPWLHIYDPIGQMACRNPAWQPIDIFAVPIKGAPCVGENDEFEEYAPPSDMLTRFPDYPQAPAIISVPVKR